MTFSPRLDILPAPQLRLWGELAGVPAEFTLYGGTAVALHLGHRSSVDFDFFSAKAINTNALSAEIPFLHDARIIQQERNTLTCLVVVQAAGRCDRPAVSFCRARADLRRL